MTITEFSIAQGSVHRGHPTGSTLWRLCVSRATSVDRGGLARQRASPADEATQALSIKGGKSIGS